MKVFPAIYGKLSKRRGTYHIANPKYEISGTPSLCMLRTVRMREVPTEFAGQKVCGLCVRKAYQSGMVDIVPKK